MNDKNQKERAVLIQKILNQEIEREKEEKEKWMKDWEGKP